MKTAQTTSTALWKNIQKIVFLLLPILLLLSACEMGQNDTDSSEADVSNSPSVMAEVEANTELQEMRESFDELQSEINASTEVSAEVEAQLQDMETTLQSIADMYASAQEECVVVWENFEQQSESNQDIFVQIETELNNRSDFSSDSDTDDDTHSEDDTDSDDDSDSDDVPSTQARAEVEANLEADINILVENRGNLDTTIENSTVEVSSEVSRVMTELNTTIETARNSLEELENVEAEAWAEFRAETESDIQAAEDAYLEAQAAVEAELGTALSSAAAKDQFVANTESRLNVLVSNASELRQDVEALGAAATATLDQAMDALAEAQQAAQQEVTELQNAEVSAWVQYESSVNAQLQAFQDQYNAALGLYNEISAASNVDL